MAQAKVSLYCNISLAAAQFRFNNSCSQFYSVISQRDDNSPITLIPKAKNFQMARTGWGRSLRMGSRARSPLSLFQLRHSTTGCSSCALSSGADLQLEMCRLLLCWTQRRRWTSSGVIALLYSKSLWKITIVLQDICGI